MSRLLFDLDNTLLDTGKLVNQGFKPAIQEFLGQSDIDFESANEDYWSDLADSTDFDPETYISFLAGRFGKNQTELLSLMYQPRWYTESLFSETTAVLTQLRAAGHELGIFSQGIEKYQSKKLELSGLKEFFAPELVFIFDRKLTPQNLVTLPESIVVDDRLAVIKILNDVPQITPVWLNRKNEDVIENCMKIQSLSELSKLLETV